jgi:hypothetical protein
LRWEQVRKEGGWKRELGGEGIRINNLAEWRRQQDGEGSRMNNEDGSRI